MAALTLPRLALLAGGALALAGLAVVPAGPAAGPPGPAPAVAGGSPAEASPPGGTELGTVGAVMPAAKVRYRWPTGEPAEVVRAFDNPEQPWDAGHRGVDVAHGVGRAVLAAGDGVVAFAGTVVDRPVVSVQHADGVRTTYEPVLPVVRAGQEVRAGQLLGHLAAGHCPPHRPSCLHWGARRGPSTYLDPLALVGARALVRLLPDDVGPP
ncbi:M23 family metallopeptidase [Georgenia thermotolerans]|uniref:Peptidoglycan DD-metalloendopeptidase family protein n=1 Tax=Georgenia thermotolerans TaxID=527326 RepID=A0A7J5UMZ6_9MICO|nr:M23 family metallopeptidase [Georgenia thermotolerans]KAE8763766.1 peptidoglycan DD-metalloendopeptidase family protein [Georgenia thermotolerans]